MRWPKAQDDNSQLKRDAEWFYTSTPADNEIREARITAEKNANDVHRLKDLFKMKRGIDVQPITSNLTQNIDFQTSNNFYHNMTDTSVKV